MTRVNSAIAPESLCDQHLVAEYGEVLRINRESYRTPFHKIPKEFKLGKGHVKFFADKGKFIMRRHNDLKTEMHKRGYNTNYTYTLHNEGYNNDYTTTQKEFNELQYRIIEQMPDKPRYYKKYISVQEAIDMLKPYQP